LTGDAAKGDLMDHIVYRCGDCELDTANRIFRKGGTEYALEPKVFAVLTQLVTRPGELLTRDQLLDAVWGHRYVTPSTLNRVIALARRSLVDDAEEPKFIQTVHGSGYRYVGPVEKTAMSAEPRARFAPPASVRLPAPLHNLIGRGHELSQIDAMLNGGRSLTLLGTGGMGKTQCALSFAQAHANRYPDGVWFFDLAPMRRADEWLQALALALAIAPAGERELLGKITGIFADRRALLLLDNCDRISAAVGSLAVELLRGTEHLKILATSQQQLRCARTAADRGSPRGGSAAGPHTGRSVGIQTDPDQCTGDRRHLRKARWYAACPGARGGSLRAALS
jgi:DNA-binding winged helix-turn-helix (wHTH) protein